MVEVEVEIEVGVGLRLGLEVSEDEEAGQSGGEEYQDQPQRTHFETKKCQQIGNACALQNCAQRSFFWIFFEMKEMEKGKK